MPVEAALMLRFPCHSIIFCLTQGSFCKVLAYKFIEILYLLTILLLDLNILGTRMEASVLSSQNQGVTTVGMSTPGTKECSSLLS
jgi:hypothetical protein